MVPPPPTGSMCGGLRYIDELVLRDRDSDGDGTLDERLYALQDANWNVVALTNAAGVVQERYVYDAYGTVTVLDTGFTLRATSLYDWEMLYAGYRREPGGLYYVRHRYLHPRLGAWVNRDPLTRLSWYNLYCYAGSSPLAFTDPLGLIPPQVAACLAGAGLTAGASLAADWWRGDIDYCRSALAAALKGAFGCMAGLCLNFMLTKHDWVTQVARRAGNIYGGKGKADAWGALWNIKLKKYRYRIGQAAAAGAGATLLILDEFANDIAEQMCKDLKETVDDLGGIENVITDPLEDISYRRCYRFCCAAEDCASQPNRVPLCVRKCAEDSKW